MPRKKLDVLSRFNAKVNKTEGCWLWTGAKKTSGYGNFFVNERYVLAHRASWEMVNGPIQDGLYVCHKCDTPSCVNPDHLFLGTPKDNQRDMYSKGRGNRHAKLSHKEVAEIRLMRASGAMLKTIAAKFNTTESNVSVICSFRSRAIAPPSSLE